MAAKENKKTERSLLADRSDIDRELRTSALDSIGAQAYLKQMDRNREKAMAGIDNGIISGGATAENALAQKQKLNEQYDNAEQNFLINKDNQKRGWLYDRRQLDYALQRNNAQRAQNWVNIASNTANAIGNLGEAYLDSGDKLLPDAAPAATDADAAAKAAATEQIQMQQPEATATPAEPQIQRELVKLAPEDELEEERLRNLTGKQGA